MLTHSQEYELKTAKSTCTPCMMLYRMENYLSCQEIKMKSEEVYYTILTEVHATNDLHREHQHNETLQEYIQNFIDLTENAMDAHPFNITNRVIIFLFSKHHYTHDIQKYIADAKPINTLADTGKLAHQSLLKLKKYEGLLYNEEHGVSNILQKTDMYKVTSDNIKSKFSINYTTNKTNKMYIYLGICWKCNEFGHVAKECKNTPSNT